MNKPSIAVDICPSCGRDKYCLFDRIIDHNIELNYQICQYCSFVFMSPRFSDNDLINFYRAEYRLLYNDSESPILSIIDEQIKRGIHLIKILLSMDIKYLDSHLDIGCSTGQLLLAVQSKWPGIRSVGIEPSDAYRDSISNSDILVFPSLEKMLTETKQRFSLVSISRSGPFKLDSCLV